MPHPLILGGRDVLAGLLCCIDYCASEQKIVPLGWTRSVGWTVELEHRPRRRQHPQSLPCLSRLISQSLTIEVEADRDVLKPAENHFSR